MNVIARLEYEPAYYDSAVHRFIHEDTPLYLNGYAGKINYFCDSHEWVW